jgi:heme A synthase
VTAPGCHGQKECPERRLCRLTVTAGMSRELDTEHTFMEYLHHALAGLGLVELAELDSPAAYVVPDVLLVGEESAEPR